MIANPDINNLIYMCRHYEELAKNCHKFYSDLNGWYRVYDYYMEMVTLYETAILSHI